MVKTDSKIDIILDAIEASEIKPKQGFFYDGQVFVADLIKSANSAIVLIDNYIDESIVYHFGASLTDLGKKWFTFSKMELSAKEMIDNLKREVE